MNYKFQLSVLTGAIMIAVLVTLIAPMYTGAVGPTANPPDNAGLVPNFSGLNVTNNITTDTLTANSTVTGGDATFDSVTSNGDISAGGALTAEGTTTLNGYSYLNSLVYIDANKDGFPEITAKDFNIATIGKYSTGVYLAVENLLGSMLIQATAGAGILTINANDLNITAKVDVDGQLTANQVGSYYQIWRKQATNNYSYVSCYAGDFLTSCNGKTTAGSLIYAYPSTNICQVSSTSAAGSTYARAVCFDPAGVTTGIINADL